MEDGPTISSREMILVVKIVWTKIAGMQWLQKKLIQNPCSHDMSAYKTEGAQKILKL